MGFDMYLEQVPSELQTMVLDHQKHMQQIYSTPSGTAESRELWDTLPPDPSYFRLNIWGMVEFTKHMLQLGMVTTDYPPPNWNRFTQEEADSLLAGPDDGIPIDKLSTNDHWLVRPEEIKSALKAYEQHTRAEVRTIVHKERLARWDSWIEFLRLAQENGGFRVD